MSKIGFIQSEKNKEEKPWDTAYSRNSMIFGKKTFVPIKMNKALNENTIVIGTSGTGKTYSFVEPNVLQGNANFVIADAKGDILRDTGASLRKMGYQIQVLNLVDLKHSMTYNPLSYLEDQLDYLNFADQVIATDVTGKQSVKNSGQDPMWNTSVETLLQALIYFVKQFLPPKQQTMANVNLLFELINKSPKDINEALELVKKSKLKFKYSFDFVEDNYDESLPSLGELIFNWAAEKDPTSQAVKMWNAVASGKVAEKMWSSIVGILGVYLARYSIRDVENLMSSNQIDFKQLLEPKTALFILYDDADTSKNYLSNTLYSQLFAYLFRASRKTGNRLPVKVRFFLDDFSNIYIPDFPQKLSTARSRNISICMMLQDEGQLNGMFGEHVAETVISNCKNYLLTGTTGLKQAQLSAERFTFLDAPAIRRMKHNFLLDVEGYTTETDRYDFHDSPNYVDAVFEVNKYFITPNINIENDSELLKIMLSLPGLYKVETSPYIKNKRISFPF